MSQAEDSVLQVCQLRAEANQGVGKVPTPSPASQAVRLTLLSENSGKHCREWPAGKTESENMLLIQEKSKHSVHRWLSHQSGWAYTVKQGATTIHEDSAAKTVSTSSLTMEVEVLVTHHLRWIASRGDSQTTRDMLSSSQIQRACYKK